MRINIIYTIQEGPYGGGNQFLKALKKSFESNDAYTDDPDQADVFLFNSFQNLRQALKYKKKYPDKIFVHRLDGPISLYRNSPNHSIDRLIFEVNNFIADATIFQSDFSLQANKDLGMDFNQTSKVIFNAPDNSIFYPNSRKDHDFKNRKLKLISVSWSSNMMKGFDVYQYLDKNLDFSKYDYKFVGNSPLKFDNIRQMPPQDSPAVADLLRGSDIYITASKKDPCSNSLIEALSCGLPAVVLNDGGHPELIGQGGEKFDSPAEAVEKIEKIRHDYNRYANNLPLYNLADIAKQYSDFIEDVFKKVKNKELAVKKFSLGNYIRLNGKIFLNRIGLI
jgi:glycosyltransferase involved in cell wall biosynthesis